MIKLLMTWDIRAGKESEYFEFVTKEFAPRMVRMGVQPTEAWYTVYGKAPQILAGFVADDRATLDAFLQSDDWKSMLERLETFVQNFQYKIVPALSNFQL
jgi:hypothetical protein